MRKFVALSTIHIRFILRKLLKHKRFQVGAIDDIDLFTYPFISIVNTDISTLSGTHWIAFYINSQKQCLELFDSFGNSGHPHFEIVKKFAARHNLQVVVNSYQLQTYKSLLCGYFCIYFLYYRSNGLSFKQVLNKFSKHNLNKNELIIKAFFKNIEYPKINFNTLRNKTECNIAAHDFASTCIQKNKRFLTM